MILFKTMLSVILSSILINCYSQDSTENEKAMHRYLNSLMTDKFDFESPGDGFVLTEDKSGYTRKEDNAAIRFVLMGKNYDELLNIFKDSIKMGSNVFVDSSTVHKNNKTGFYFIQKKIPPPDSGYSNYFSILIIKPLDKYLSLFFGGVYPESKDTILRKKFINSAFSIKKVTE